VPTLTDLETRLADAKRAQDMDTVRALVPVVNQARRDFRVFAEAFAEQCERNGTDIDGNARTPDQRLTAAIFGADAPSKTALARLQARWERGDVALAAQREEPGSDDTPGYQHLAHALDDAGRWEVEIWASQERIRFADLADAKAYVSTLPVHAEIHDLDDRGPEWAADWFGK